MPSAKQSGEAGPEGEKMSCLRTQMFGLKMAAGNKSAAGRAGTTEGLQRPRFSYTSPAATRGRWTAKNSTCAKPRRGTAVHAWLAANWRNRSSPSAFRGANSAGTVTRHRPVSATVTAMRRASA